MEEPIKIMITDDRERFRNFIREILLPYPVEIVGETENGKELLSLLNKVTPDIVLLDLEMPVLDGNKTFDLISEKHPEAKVIIISFYSEGILIDDYIERGAKGYIPKDAMLPEVLYSALKQVRAGGTFVYEKSSGKRRFTRRQKEILPLIFEGKTNEEIAREVYIGIRAVEKQKHRIYEKSGAGKVIDFYRYAFTRGLQFLGKKRKRREALRGQ
ncbi:MAG: response regulator transcription factor [Bacteroidota bacterium]